MDAERQEERKLRSTKATSRPKYVVGMDAHSRKLAISIWEGSDPWHPARLGENPRCDISRMKQYYEEKVPMDSITIIEASTNSALLKGMLDEIGFRAEVVRSDAIADRQRKRRVCDINDARELANAYIHGEIKEFVWTPSPKYAEYRDVLFAYRDAVKETTRTSNRIWSICCRCGFDFDIKAGETKADSIRAMIKELDIGGFIKERLEKRERRMQTRDIYSANGGVELITDYGNVVRKAREKTGLNAEDFAKSINEKKGTIVKIESQTLVPDDKLIAKLEKALNIKLKEAMTDGGTVGGGQKSQGMTLGNFIKVEKK